MFTGCSIYLATLALLSPVLNCVILYLYCKNKKVIIIIIIIHIIMTEEVRSRLLCFTDIRERKRERELPRRCTHWQLARQRFWQILCVTPQSTSSLSPLSLSLFLFPYTVMFRTCLHSSARLYIMAIDNIILIISCRPPSTGCSSPWSWQSWAARVSGSPSTSSPHSSEIDKILSSYIRDTECLIDWKLIISFMIKCCWSNIGCSES